MTKGATMAKKLYRVDAGESDLPGEHIFLKSLRQPSRKRTRKKSSLINEIGLTPQEKRQRTKQLCARHKIKGPYDNPEAVDCLLNVEETASSISGVLKNMLHSFERRNESNREIKYFDKYKVPIHRYISDLLLQRKYTDNEIISEVKKYYNNDEQTISNYLHTARSKLNQYKSITPQENGLLSVHVGRIHNNDNTEKRIIQPFSPIITKKRRKAKFSLQVI